MNFWTVKKNLWQEQTKVIFHYWKNPSFFCADVLLGLSTLFLNPYTHCRKKGMIYGEIPLTTLHSIIKWIPITSETNFLELGSGRGKAAFWIALFYGCKTTGLDSSSLFITIANKIGKILKINNLSFISGNWMDADFSKANCVYLYSTCIEDEEMHKLTLKMQSLPKNAYVITISSELPNNLGFVVTNVIPVAFPWGKTEAFIHKKIKHQS